MDEDEKKRLEDIVNSINRDVELPPYDTKDNREGYSKRYQEYKKEERKARERTKFERFCYKSASILNIKADKSVRSKLNPPIKLLNWEITPGMVLSASIIAGLVAFTGWLMLFGINMVLGILPMSVMLISMMLVFAAGGYIYYKPIFEAQNKVIRSSGEMILSILYMVIYMRSSPNLEGAIRFAALNLDGPISDDLKGVLWNLEVGNYNKIEIALEDYTRAWKDYNEDYLESLQLLKAAVNEPNNDRREKLLQDSIDRILDGTQEKMKHYAQNLKTPVMILNAMGAMLPVLAMIMLPLISVFLANSISAIQLLLAFNIVLPGFLYWFMQKILSSRPPTVSSQPVSKESLPERGYYHKKVMGKQVKIPMWIVGLGIFLLVGSYGILGYISTFGISSSNPLLLYPVGDGVDLSSVPAIFKGQNGLNPFPMLMRSVSIIMGLGLGIGVTKYIGSLDRRREEAELEKIEKQFPTALFELGNKISGGTPIELALEEASKSTSEMEISGLFGAASRNVHDMGMTFEDAVFDESYGALRRYPSQMIQTVMKAILESSQKGTKMASMAMMTISRYLQNVHKTQEHLNDLMDESTTTIQMLAYMLAPIVSGVAVGMSQTIITAMYQLGQQFKGVNSDIPTSGSAGGLTGLPSGFDSAIPPEVLQFVVGGYLIQLLFILGTFYMKISHGENQTYKNLFVGKVLISGIILYSISLIIISVIFGGIISGISA